MNILPIIQDTREKKPWIFSEHNVSVDKVDAGDYILKGSNLITIDRKQRVSELANNLGMYGERFERELVRMEKYRFRYIVCEFSYEKLLMFPKGAGLPRRVMRRIRIKGKFLAKRVDALSEEYGVAFIFCTNRAEAQEQAIKLFYEALDAKEDYTT